MTMASHLKRLKKIFNDHNIECDIECGFVTAFIPRVDYIPYAHNEDDAFEAVICFNTQDVMEVLGY